MASQVEHIKWVANRFMVDGFAFSNSRCKHYFLTHFHSDHTVGLTRGFNGGIIYCTQVTKNLLLKDFRLTPSCQIEVLEYEQPITVQGIQVTAIPANHCPGACMLLFEVPSADSGSPHPEVILHTGDFRWQHNMLDSSALKRSKVDTLYLDTTYSLPRYRLPSQEHCIQAMVEAMRQAIKEQPATLFVVAAYRIGKEKVYLSAARQLGCKVWVSPAKRGVLQLLDLPSEDMALLADSPEEAQLHVVSWGLKPESLLQYLGSGAGGEEAAQEEGSSDAEAGQGPWVEPEAEELLQEGSSGAADAPADLLHEGGDSAHTLPPDALPRGSCWRRVIGIRATGWTLRKGGQLHVWKQGPIALMSVPYSEHSSWDELTDCVRSLRPKKLVPTVNVETPLKFRAMLDKFAALMDLSKDKSRMDFYMRPPPQPARLQAAAARAEDEVHRSGRQDTIDLTPSGSSREDTLEADALCPACDAPVSMLRDDEAAEEDQQYHVPGSMLRWSEDGERCAPAGGPSGSRQGGVTPPFGGPSGSRQRGVAPSTGVDLSLVDVQEQLRIYDSIVARRQSHCTAAATPRQADVQIQSSTATPGSQKRKRASKPPPQQQQQQQQLENGLKRQAASSVKSDLKGNGSQRHGIKSFFAQLVKP